MFKVSVTRDAEFWDYKGYIHDVGGPTANFRFPACDKQLKHGSCKHKQCLFPEPCDNLTVDHTDLLDLLRKMREMPTVKKVFLRSGLRYDYIMADKNKRFMKELCEHHVSGQLKVAPEHVAEEVLEHMGKPCGRTYDDFVDLYKKTNKNIGKEQYIVPYLMSSHPGSTLKSAIRLAEYLRDIGYTPEQVQDFYPTPGTLSTAMFYTGKDPLTGKKVYVPKSYEEKQMQRALLQFRVPRNYDLVVKALKEAGREDLIGDGPKCLVRDKSGQGRGKSAYSKGGKSQGSKSRPNSSKSAKSKNTRSSNGGQAKKGKTSKGPRYRTK